MTWRTAVFLLLATFFILRMRLTARPPCWITSLPTAGVIISTTTLFEVIYFQIATTTLFHQNYQNMPPRKDICINREENEQNEDLQILMYHVLIFLICVECLVLLANETFPYLRT